MKTKLYEEREIMRFNEGTAHYRDKLCDLALGIRDNSCIEEIDLIKEEILSYLSTFPGDEEIKALLYLMDMMVQEHEFNDYYFANPALEMILTRLSTERFLSFLWLRLGSRFVVQAMQPEIAYKAANNIIEQLDGFKYEKRSEGVKRATLMNVLANYVRAKQDVLASNNLDAVKKLSKTKEIEGYFDEHFDKLVEICNHKEGYYRVALATGLVRKGIIYKDKRFIDRGFSILEEDGNDEAAKLLLRDVKEAEMYDETNTSKQHFNLIFGRNVNRRLKALGMSTKNFVAKAGVGEATLNYIIKGETDATVYQAVCIADAFDITMEEMFKGADTVRSYPSAKDLQQIIATVNKLDEEQRKVILDMAEMLTKTNNYYEF